MTGISFTPQNTDADPPATPAGDVVQAGGWWPDINITELRDVLKIDTSVSANKLRDAVRLAVLEIAGELAQWQAGQILQGREALTDVPARLEVDGQSDYVLRWKRAVASVVGADLNERLVPSQLSQAGLTRVEELRTDVDVHQRNVRHAVRDFLGVPRIRARLI